MTAGLTGKQIQFGFSYYFKEDFDDIKLALEKELEKIVKRREDAKFDDLYLQKYH